jgi:tetratricopeptide (TPR) repeat protein
VIPGEIISLAIRKSWQYGRRLHISGGLLSHCFDLLRLGLAPLRLHEKGNWDPGELFEGWSVEEGEERIPDFYVPIVAAGVRPAFEMEQVIPGNFDPDGDDPILQSVEHSQRGDRASARAILMKLLEEDLRCLDAFVHLGNLEIDGNTEQALLYYQAGLEIGGLSLPDKFNGLLSWGNIDNRPYLRCLHGYGLALWRLERFGEAEEVFERLLWLDPSDGIGIRLLIPEVGEKKPWRPET